MNSETKEFSEIFNSISNKGWIKSVNMGTGSVGLTFEREISKKIDSMFFPDYKNLEIKCTTRYSRYPITLFSCAFEGPTFPEINRIIDLYGYKHYKFPELKVLKLDIDSIKTKKCGNYKFKLFIDENENKLFLEVFDLDDRLIEKKSFIYLDSLIEKLRIKISNLVVVHGSRKIINDEEYFRYYKMEEYKLIDDKRIIDLLKDGRIIATLESRIGMSGKYLGKYKNKNLVFRIKRKYIEDLYKKELIINNDYKINKIFLYPDTGFYIMK